MAELGTNAPTQTHTPRKATIAIHSALGVPFTRSKPVDFEVLTGKSEQ